MPEADEIAHQLSDAIKFYEKSRSKVSFMDVHCWRFTPDSYALVMEDLTGIGLTNLKINYLSTTNGCEFYASLKKIIFESEFKNKKSRFDILKSIKAVK